MGTCNYHCLRLLITRYDPPLVWSRPRLIIFCLKTGPDPRPLTATPRAPLPPLVITVDPPGLMCSSTIWISESTRLMVMLLGRLISGSAAALLIDIPCKYNVAQNE